MITYLNLKLTFAMTASGSVALTPFSFSVPLLFSFRFHPMFLFSFQLHFILMTSHTQKTKAVIVRRTQPAFILFLLFFSFCA